MKSICIDKYLPKFVFNDKSAKFLFFDSDWLFDSAFIDIIKELLSSVDASAACLFKLDELNVPLVVNLETTQEQYSTLLQGEGPTTGWLYDMGRYALIPEVGNWSIYCERESEIAVISICDELLQRLQPVLATLHAFPIQKALSEELSYGFSDRALSAEWKKILSSEY